MKPEELKKTRKRLGWSQQEAARRLGLSQPYLSMLENGERQLTPSLARSFMRVYGLSPSVLPATDPLDLRVGTHTQALAEQLAALGYPGFSYLRRRARTKNPAEVLLTALARDDLEARLVEALPWLLLRYWDLDVDWLVDQAKRLDLQNRLGFVVTMARELARKLEPRNPQREQVLAELEARLEQSRLARVDTLCQASLSDAERQWLRANRPREAQQWNLLTSWNPEGFRYVP